MDENNLSSLGLNFPPILVIKVMQVIAYMLTCIYCVTIINCTSIRKMASIEGFCNCNSSGLESCHPHSI